MFPNRWQKRLAFYEWWAGAGYSGERNWLWRIMVRRIVFFNAASEMAVRSRSKYNCTSGGASGGGAGAACGSGSGGGSGPILKRTSEIIGAAQKALLFCMSVSFRKESWWLQMGWSTRRWRTPCVIRSGAVWAEICGPTTVAQCRPRRRVATAVWRATPVARVESTAASGVNDFAMRKI